MTDPPGAASTVSSVDLMVRKTSAASSTHRGRRGRAVIALSTLVIGLVVGAALAGAGGDAAFAHPSGPSSLSPATGPLDEEGQAQLPPEANAVATGSGLVVPILVYHFIRINPVATDLVGFNLSVTPAEFDAQLTELQRLGANTITPAQLRVALGSGQPLPPKPVMLTFDDGYADFATAAAPSLFAHHFVGVDFVVSGFIGRPDYMTADQVKEVSAMGMVIGAHTMSHAALAGLPSATVSMQLRGSKSALEQLTGSPVVDFAYPFGSYSSATIPLVKAAGFADAMTMDAGDAQHAEQMFRLRRVRVGGTDTPSSVAAKALLGGSAVGGTPLPASPVGSTQPVTAGIVPGGDGGRAPGRQ